MDEQQRCRKGVPGCECDWHSPEWREFARDHHFELPEIDEQCAHHRQQEVRRG